MNDQADFKHSKSPPRYTQIPWPSSKVKPPTNQRQVASSSDYTQSQQAVSPSVYQLTSEASSPSP